MINILEILMIVSTFMYSYLILYCKRSSFIFGIISSCIMTYILILSKVYIQAVLNIVYISMYIHSFIMWKKEEDKIKINNISNRGMILTVIYILTFTVFIGYAFSKVESAYPYLDAFTSACSMVAVFLLSRKTIESSYIFMMANITSIIVFYLTKDYSGIVTFIIYMIFNVIRIFTWSKIRKTEILNT